MARHPARPQTRDYIEMIVKDFDELHGDRTFGDDKTMVSGMGRIGGHKVMVIGHHKGRDTKEKIACNFGCAHPEGYRKALAKMQFAEKFGLPVVTFIDTPGAYPGIGSEERGRGGGDCGESAGDVAAEGADRVHRDRRRGVWRGAGDRRGRSAGDDAVCVVLRDFAGGVQRDFVEGRGECAGGGGGVEADEQAFEGAGDDR